MQRHPAQRGEGGAGHAGSAAAGRRGGVAIKRVFPDVEIKGRQFVGAEIEQRAGDAVEVEPGIALANHAIQFGQPRQHEFFQLRHLLEADAFLFVKARQVGQHEADGVAQPAIGFDIGLDDVLADAKVFGEVRCRGP